MKLKFVPALLFAMVAAVAYANLRSRPYDNTKPPTLPLPLAYEKALAFLGPKTNEYHCIIAVVTNVFTAKGDWYFDFYSTNANVRFPVEHIDVSFDGDVHQDFGFR